MHDPSSAPARRRFIPLVLLAGLLQAASSFAWAADSPLIGIWTGSYTCQSFTATPVTGAFTLEVADPDNALYQGVVRFAGSGGTRSPEQNAAYKAIGRFNARDRGFSFVPDAWLERPAGFSSMPLEGRIHDNGLSIEGTLRNCGGGQGSGTFAAQRQDADGTSAKRSLEESLEGLIEAAQPTASLEPFLGDWEGQLTCDPPSESPPSLRISLIGAGDTIASAAILTVPQDPRGPHRTLYGGQLETPDSVALLKQGQVYGLYPPHGSVGIYQDKITLALAGSGDQLTASMHPPRIGGTRCQGENIPLRRVGVPIALPPGVGPGVWAGYYFGDHIDLAEVKLNEARYLWGRSGAEQVRIVFAQTPQGLAGVYERVRPITESPLRQHRYAATIRPLVVLDDGRLLFAQMEILRDEGRSAPAPPRSGKEAFSLPRPLIIAGDADGHLLIEEYGWSPFLLRPATEAIQAALDAGEGPPLELPSGLGGALRAAPSVDAQCRALLGWWEPILSGTPAGSSRSPWSLERGLPLLEDTAFVPVFGLPYSLTTETERNALWNLIPLCARRVSPDLQWAYRPFEGSSVFEQLQAALINRRESADWISAAQAEVAQLPNASASLARLDAIAAQANQRAKEITPGERDALSGAIATKRDAIAIAVMLEKARTLDRWPNNLETLRELRTLLLDASMRSLAPDVRADLRSRARQKADAIATPILAKALETARAAPDTLDGLAVVTRATQETERLFDYLTPELGLDAARRMAEPIGARREALVRAPAIQQAFRDALMTADIHGEPRAAVEAEAERYVDRRVFSGSAAIAAYREAVRDAIARHEIASIDFADHSASALPGEPTAEDMLLAVKARIDEMNDQLRATLTRCRQGNPTDPIMAAECLALLIAAGQRSDFQMRMTRFGKIGCATAVNQAGFVCDYDVGFAIDSPWMRGRIGDLLGAGEVARGRFVRVQQGWLFTPVN